jgi:hypothetical protein
MGLLFFRDQEEYDNYMSRCEECEQAESVFCNDCEDRQAMECDGCRDEGLSLCECEDEEI